MEIKGRYGEGSTQLTQAQAAEIAKSNALTRLLMESASHIGIDLKPKYGFAHPQVAHDANRSFMRHDKPMVASVRLNRCMRQRCIALGAHLLDLVGRICDLAEGGDIQISVMDLSTELQEIQEKSNGLIKFPADWMAAMEAADLTQIETGCSGSPYRIDSQTHCHFAIEQVNRLNSEPECEAGCMAVRFAGALPKVN